MVGALALHAEVRKVQGDLSWEYLLTAYIDQTRPSDILAGQLQRRLLTDQGLARASQVPPKDSHRHT